jgi:hypothetical protein
MKTYTVTAKAGETGFNVVVVGDDGIRQTTLGFASRSEANIWIARTERMARPWALPGAFGGRKVF